MTAFSCALLLFLTINIANHFTEGQRTTGDCSNDERDKHNSDATLALAVVIQSELRNLKAQLSRLEDRVEQHDRYMKDSIQKLTRQMQLKKLPRSECPNGFNYTANGTAKCYAVLRNTTSWYTAQQNCRQLHKEAHLAIISGSWEQQIITNMVQNYECLGTFRTEDGVLLRSHYYWIGGQLRDMSDCSSPFVWKPDNKTSLSIIGYTNWYEGEPNCAQGIEKCLSIRTTGKWNDLACHWSFCSVCEVLAESKFS